MAARRRRSIWVAVVLGLVSAAGCKGAPDLRFRVLFEDASGLSAGTPVIYRGLALGEVESVGLHEGLVSANIRIDALQAANVCEDADFLIRADGAGLAPQPVVEMLPMTGRCVELAEGATVRGSESRLEALLKDALDRAEGTVREWSQSSEAQRVRDAASELARRADAISRDLAAFPDSPEAERLRDLARELASRAGDLAQRGQEELKRRLPELESEFDALVRRLRRDMQEPES